MNFYFVNQKHTYNEEKKDKLLWAPLLNINGDKNNSWESMKAIKKGDIIFSNKEGNIVSINVAKSDCYLRTKPKNISNKWNPEGRSVDLDYFELQVPVEYLLHRAFILDNRKTITPFDVTGKAKVGYLYALDKKTANYFLSVLSDVDKLKILPLLGNFGEKSLQSITQNVDHQKSVNTFKINIYSEDKLTEKEKNKKISKKNKKLSTNYRINTDIRLKATRLNWADYSCEVNSAHQTFINPLGLQYMECHHIIPVYAQNDFPTINLDSIANLISICPTCHAKMHYGDEAAKREVFDKIYSVRKEELLNKGFDFEDENEIFNKYYK